MADVRGRREGEIEVDAFDHEIRAEERSGLRGREHRGVVAHSALDSFRGLRQESGETVDERGFVHGSSLLEPLTSRKHGSRTSA